MILFIPKRLLVLIAAIFFFINAHAQTPKLDSLKNVLSKEQSVPVRLDLIIKICERHFSLPLDTFAFYIKMGNAIAVHGSAEEFRMKNFNCIYLSKSGKLEEALLMVDSLI